MNAPEVVVVGSGIVGAATAYHLARADVPTMLVDRADPGQATRAGAGIVCPVTATVGHDELVDLAFSSAQHYLTLDGWLREDRGVGDCGFSLVGLLSVGLSPAGTEQVSATADWAALVAARTRWGALTGHAKLGPGAARSRVPVLAPEIGGALLIDWGGRVDGDRFRAALIEAARKRGAVVRHGSVVRVTSGEVELDGDTVSCRAAVVCAGAWSGRLIPELTAVRPLRGEILHVCDEDLDTSDWPLVQVEADGPYLIPWPGGRIAVGATAEPADGTDARPTVPGLRWCIEALDRSTGAQADRFRVVESRLGFRPVSVDGLPAIGTLPGRPGVVIATGHGADGLSWGPFTGQLAAELVLGHPPSIDLSAFDPGRFTRPDPVRRAPADEQAPVYAHARRLPA